MPDDSLSRIIGSVDRRKRRNLPRGGATRSTVVDERTSSGQTAARGKVILNEDFDELTPGYGSYWSTEELSTAVADSSSQVQGVKITHPTGGAQIRVFQTTDPDDDITKVI